MRLRAECGGCVFFSEGAESDEYEPAGEEDGLPPSGYCRRYPPTSQPMVDDESVGFLTLWPVVRADNWCGEYRDAPDETLH